MTVRTSFVEFLRTGRLGPIVPDKTTRADILRLLGRPQTSWRNEFGSIIYSYGDVEFGFAKPFPNSVLDYIQIEHIVAPGFQLGYRRLHIRTGIHNSALERFDSVVRFLRRNGIKAVPVERNWVHDKGLFTEDGILVLRHDEEPEWIVGFFPESFPHNTFKSRIPMSFARWPRPLWARPGRRITNRLRREAREAARQAASPAREPA